ncbi:MAG: sigma-70 family RNA polymerase sigma factor [Endomicrobia bacterium]|nr:sigma-70 family RNA polymerase sigma factor [Endomicrobiia bacterium]MCX7940647.1 sigma-70 family RNA polymerase sigma factor [Endomicrobiia bacterium]MDW8056381.1 sigma-70 family RNA polymerase sigma factor [Elusimicrobiota bacterium]
MTTKNKIDDTQLVELAKNGDTKAFETLIKRYEDRIYSLAYRILQDKEEAYDVLQETAISAFKNIKRFKGESTFSTWITRIALNFALMRKRKQKSLLKSAQLLQVEDDDKLPEKLETEKLQATVDWSDNPSLTFEREELKEALYDSLNKLPEKYRTVFILKELEGRSVEEISKILGISQSATKTRLHRGRMYLRWLLEKYVTQGYQV